MAQVAIGRHHRDPWGDANRFLPPAGIQVFAERGAAWLEMPDRIQWSDAGGIHEERLPVEPTLGEVLNDQFLRLVRGEESLAPTFADTLAIARGVRGLRGASARVGKSSRDRRAEMDGAAPRWCGPAVVLAALVGLGLMADSLRQSSATYDEVAYLRVAARWWRTGDQDEITRMGSPLTFWKLQQVPVLWALDRLGYGEVVDRPIEHQQWLLPMVRLGSLWIWLIALGLTAWWSRLLYGPRAMAFAAWIVHPQPEPAGAWALATMEFPLLACTTGMFLLFWRFLQTGDRRPFWGAAVLGGLAWSCKFTTVLVPPILALVWWIDRTTLSRGERVPEGRVRGLSLRRRNRPARTGSNPARPRDRREDDRLPPGHDPGQPCHHRVRHAPDQPDGRPSSDARRPLRHGDRPVPARGPSKPRSRRTGSAS